MVDQTIQFIPPDSTRGLLQEVMQQLDQRVAHFKIGTPYEKVRMSDARVFVAAARLPRSIAQIARVYGISRQAVQSSVQRLIALNVVELLPHPDSHRDKIISVTAHGNAAQAQAVKHLGWLDNECAEILGAKGLEQFRTQLLALTAGLKARQASGDIGDEREIAEAAE
jgi:DNA-binding MarR family transcriptional regulator